ncbi:carbohydrate ABC transporter permease [Microbacterium sp.]|uniref:carbohydrate ABC transporter permease n=1 Tax=Microbacterium sp. TaxID=51671 RepID=UPI003C721871
MTSLTTDAAAAAARTRPVRRINWRRVPGYAFLSVFALFSVFPLYFMVVSATNSTQDVIASRMTPGGHLLDNFVALTKQQDIGAAMTSSFLIAIGTTVLALVVCAVAGYGFEIYHSRGKDVVMAILMLAMMIPFAAIMIPLFRMFAQFGMVNSLFAVIIPSISVPLLILLFRQASRSFPYEIIEAARIDGLTELSIFARIYVPTMKSTFAAAAVITFMASWNNFLWPRVILLDNAVQTMPMLIANLTAGYVTDYGVLMLAVLLTSLPTIAIFLILQRAFAQGITGAIK